jgi:phosphonate metabolism protein PhnN/1,5-bisphosphokinase (PRPP-forming)
MTVGVKAGARMLFLVVGPSGVGKDTLINGACAAMAGDPGFRFVRRIITRPPGPGEDHEAVDAVEFARRRDAGKFALHWQAHGLEYGIPADIAVDLAAGRAVVANVSRRIIVQAMERFLVVVLKITAPPSMLAQRLIERGREEPAQIADRLARKVALPDEVLVRCVVNDRTPAHGVAAVMAILRGHARPAVIC